MAQDARLHPGRELVPNHVSRALIQCENAVLLFGRIDAIVVLASQFALEHHARVRTNGRGEEDPITPHDWARQTQARDRRLPENIGAFIDIPGDRQVRALSQPARTRSAKAWPVLCSEQYHAPYENAQHPHGSTLARTCGGAGQNPRGIVSPASVVGIDRGSIPSPCDPRQLSPGVWAERDPNDTVETSAPKRGRQIGRASW